MKRQNPLIQDPVIDTGDGFADLLEEVNSVAFYRAQMKVARENQVALVKARRGDRK